MKRGFTLIELITVIAILGVLMIMAGTAVFKVIDDSRKSLLEEQVKGLGDAAISYVLSKGPYLVNCASDFDPANPTDRNCYTTVSVNELVTSHFFENHHNLCDLNREIVVYQMEVGTSGELHSYVPDNTCSY